VPDLESITMHRPVLLSSQFPLVGWRSDPTAWRRRAAHVLLVLGVGLRRLARRLAPQAHPARVAGLVSLPELEFHAEAGAPEGALYVNGDYVGHIDVARL
jgi:hypothetical protein